MKFFQACAVVLAFMAFEVQAEAKIEAAKPLEAEQNFNLLKQFGHVEESKLESDLLDEGSGWDDDDEDYDEDYYDDEDDEYYDDDDFGSGDDQLLHQETFKTESKAKLTPDQDSDLHFSDDKKAKSEILYEYYNELLYGDDEDDMAYLDEVEKDLSEVNDNVKITKNNDSEKSPNWNLQPSYIFLMLTSALITFAIVVLAFILCRKSMLSRQKNKKSMPFVISHTSGHVIQNQKSSPIVKNYQRVPTSTKELMQQQQPQMAEMGLSETQKPLLT